MLIYYACLCVNDFMTAKKEAAFCKAAFWRLPPINDLWVHPEMDGHQLMPSQIWPFVDGHNLNLKPPDQLIQGLRQASQLIGTEFDLAAAG